MVDLVKHMEEGMGSEMHIDKCGRHVMEDWNTYLDMWKRGIEGDRYTETHGRSGGKFWLLMRMCKQYLGRCTIK